MTEELKKMIAVNEVNTRKLTSMTFKELQENKDTPAGKANMKLIQTKIMDINESIQKTLHAALSDQIDAMDDRITIAQWLNSLTINTDAFVIPMIQRLSHVMKEELKVSHVPAKMPPVSLSFSQPSIENKRKE